MKLPSFKRLLSTDFEKEFQELINQLALSLNNGIDILYQALANNITLRDNIKSIVQDVTVEVDSSGTPKQLAEFRLTIQGKVDGITVILAQNQVNSATYPVGGIFISGTQGVSTFVINNITGLQPNQAYLLRLVAWLQ